MHKNNWPSGQLFSFYLCFGTVFNRCNNENLSLTHNISYYYHSLLVINKQLNRLLKD
jgi:hypothetical protein